MGFLTTLWNWLDGNKTTIGALCLATAPLFQPHTFAHQALMYIGGAFASGGILHKLFKGTKNTGK